MSRMVIATVIILIIGFSISCSGAGSDPVSPGNPEASLQIANRIPYASNRYLWGYWNVTYIPETDQFEIVPARALELHVNVRRALEVGACDACFVIGDKALNPDGDLDVEISLIHPYTDPALAGFDVRGIIIFNGTHEFVEHGLTISRHENDEYQVMNPDGYTELWAPSIFPEGWISRPLFEYSEGNLAHLGEALPTTLNAYKAYHSLTNRRVFEPGLTIDRTWAIRFPEGGLSAVPLKFGYAIDASWAIPDPLVNPQIPDDFPILANSFEAYRIDATFTGKLTPVGGSLNVEIKVYDWQGKDTIEEVVIECEPFFSGLITANYSSTGSNYFSYTAVVPNPKHAPIGVYPLLISVKDTKQIPIVKQKIPETRAYMVFDIEVKPLVEALNPVQMSNFPFTSAFDTVTETCFFSPKTGLDGLSIVGIDHDFGKVTGYPAFKATSAFGLSSEQRLMWIASDIGTANDIYAINIDDKDIKYTMDVETFSGKIGAAPIDFVVNDDAQEVWVSLYNDNQVACFSTVGIEPAITRIDVGDGPLFMTIDNDKYRIFVSCQNDDTVTVIDGATKTVDFEIELHTPLESPNPPQPALVGMSFVPSLDRLYVPMLMEHTIEYYDTDTGDYIDSVVLAGIGYLIIGSVYNPDTHLVYVTGQTIPTFEHGALWVINPNTNQVVTEAQTTLLHPGFGAMDLTNKRLFIPDPTGGVDIFHMN